METKQIDLEGITITVCRMSPLTRTEHLAIIAEGAHGGEQGHADGNDFWKNKKLHKFIQDVVMPETVQEVATDKHVYAKQRGKPCVSVEDKDGCYFLGDLGFSRFWRLAGEVSNFTGEPEATFLGGDETTGDDAGSDLEASQSMRDDAIATAEGPDSQS